METKESVGNNDNGNQNEQITWKDLVNITHSITWIIFQINSFTYCYLLHLFIRIIE